MRAVLAHTPALALETPLTDRRVQGLLRLADSAIVIGVKARKMLTDDLGFFIAFETPRTSIPADDDAVGINHVNRVVNHRIDQQTKTPVLESRGIGLIFAH
ncbi:hypothetical protein D3C87_1464460 [compost metagenome]